MNRLAAASRLGRAVCELALRTGSELAYAVASTPDETARESVVRVATALGHSVVSIPLPPSDGDAATCAADLAVDLTNATGPTLVVVDATTFDDGAIHREMLRAVARTADQARSHGGEFALFVMTGEDPWDPAPVARIVGDELKDRDWAAAIAL